MLALARPVAVITAGVVRGFHHVAMFDGLFEDVPNLRFGVVVDGEPAGERWTTWARLLERGRASTADQRVLDVLGRAPDAVCELIFTSGTTGQPKGVLHTPNTLACAAQGAIDGQRLTAADVCHMASTFAHQTGFVYGVRIPIMLGATAVYQDAWDGAGFVELVARRKSTTNGVAPMV